jgi:hypothetical protein
MIVRRSFPQVYKLKYRNGSPYWMVSARSKKWGMDERRTFGDEAEALQYAREVEARIVATGAQPTVPESVKSSATAYDKLVERLRPYDRKPEEAVDHYLKFLGEQQLRSVKPSISELADKWKAYREADKTLSKATRHELKLYSRFIRITWGDKKPDDITKQDIDLKLKAMPGNNTTRKKYLTYIRNFFNWVKDDKLLVFNPTDGLKFKLEPCEATFYNVEETKNLLQFVLKNEPDLIGYYALLTFAGLRPTEGARVQWQDINFTTGELYVRKGKTPQGISVSNPSHWNGCVTTRRGRNTGNHSFGYPPLAIERRRSGNQCRSGVQTF